MEEEKDTMQRILTQKLSNANFKLIDGIVSGEMKVLMFNQPKSIVYVYYLCFDKSLGLRKVYLGVQYINAEFFLPDSIMEIFTFDSLGEAKENMESITVEGLQGLFEKLFCQFQSN